MNLIKSFFGKKDKEIKSNEDFWNWFEANEHTFFDAVKNGKNIEKNFFDKLSPKLEELKEGYFFLTGMANENIAELIITADGNLKNIAFVENLIGAAPLLNNWKFTALKPELDIKNVKIGMNGYEFGADNIFFYPTMIDHHPDEIAIKISHDDLNEENRMTIINGVYIFLDNFLGELNLVTIIDNLDFINKKDAENEWIPISKLKDYLVWRQKEFIERYGSVRHNTDEDIYSTFEATLPNGNPLIAMINTGLLQWDGKVSHPWILDVEIGFEGTTNNGMPNNQTYQFLGKIEDEIVIELTNGDGFLNVGRQTVDNKRDVFFACHDFRKPSLIMYQLQRKYEGKLKIDFEIYKDKYWKSFKRFNSF